MRVLVTGGYGYIGAHLVDELVKRGHKVHVIDMDENSPNHSFVQKRADLLVTKKLQDYLHSAIHKEYDAVVHLAAFISVEESMQNPVMYWDNNMNALMSVVKYVKTDHLIFASTGTAFQPANAYARSKVAGEQFVLDAVGGNFAGHTIFRFYNVSGLRTGIQPTGQPTHLIRLAAMAAKGKRDSLAIFGNDWETRDGTCVRDYIHVEDLVASIANAVDIGPANTPYECLGSGKGSTVLEVVQSMKEVTGVDFRVIIANRRSGDVASMICPSQYKHIHLTKTLDDMCLSAYENI